MPAIKAWPVLIGLSIVVISNVVHSWSLKGHGVITVAVYDSLVVHNPEVAAEFLHYATILQALYADENPASVKGCPVHLPLCYYGQWPDFIKSQPLAELLPKAPGPILQSMAASHSSSWHYHNYFYSLKKNAFVSGCGQNGDLLKVLPLLIKAFQSETAIENRAVLLSFIVHLAEDAHQPLHTVSAVVANCKHDRGGNTVCVKKVNGVCEMNLHSLWDTGAGVFLQKTNFIAAASATGSIDIAAWVEESSRYAGQVYQKPAAYTSLQYQAQVRAISETRVKRAVLNLKTLLLTLLGEADE